MQASRKGEHLWLEWDGSGYVPETSSDQLFYTEGHVDLDNEIVERALASALQRWGYFDSIHMATVAIVAGHSAQLYAGSVGGESYYTICDQDGETELGDTVDAVIPITMVEVYPSWL